MMQILATIIPIIHRLVAVHSKDHSRFLPREQESESKGGIKNWQISPQFAANGIQIQMRIPPGMQ